MCTSPNANFYSDFYVSLTVHLGILLVNNQLDAQLFFLICLIYTGI